MRAQRLGAARRVFQGSLQDDKEGERERGRE